MTSKLIAVIDNGRGKRSGACDDCGTALRYEYHTEDGGRYGSCCVHAHIHRPDWLTLKAATDARRFACRKASFDKLYPICQKSEHVAYEQFRDGSITIETYFNQTGAEMVIEQLLADGWKRELQHTRGIHYILTPPTDLERSK